MKISLPLALFLAVEIGVGAFILTTTDKLPVNIASHFNGAGTANGFMPQQGYTQFMLAFALGIPALVVAAISLLLRFSANAINVPNKGYWLSPENKEGTLGFLQGHITCLGILICCFMAYVHWLLLKANAVQPPQLSNGLLFIGMAAFFFSLLAWGLALMFKFLRTPKA